MNLVIFRLLKVVGNKEVFILTRPEKNYISLPKSLVPPESYFQLKTRFSSMSNLKCVRTEYEPPEAGILVENFHRRGQALKSTLNFLGKSLGFSDRDRSLKQVRTLGTLNFRPQSLNLRVTLGFNV
jgi:hypothetical protein